MKEIKWKFIFWQFADKELMELIKSPEDFEKKFMNLLVKAINNSNNK